jgi:NAD(P)-dependent dehydrogenase (short-subunit alcohol dehydrogenase family)
LPTKIFFIQTFLLVFDGLRKRRGRMELARLWQDNQRLLKNTTSGNIVDCTMSGIENRVLIITGSNSIAASAARAAADGGAHMLLAAGDGGISPWELASETGAECWTGDLTRSESADSVVSQCLAKFGRVDGLLNAAGLSGRRFGDGPVHECTDEGFETTLALNLKAVFQMCRAVTGRMLEQSVREDGTRGAIVNLGSVLAQSPEPRHFATHAYAAAKGAVAALSRAMASYYAPQGIRVNVVAPGLARTPASEAVRGDPELALFLEKKQPLAGGMLDAAEIGRIALFLLSDQARSITGQVLDVDGGWSVTGV